jgi:mannitol/fructose-specific phosphotransferase system IIA component (Ntr-type)
MNGIEMMIALPHMKINKFQREGMMKKIFKKS